MPCRDVRASENLTPFGHCYDLVVVVHNRSAEIHHLDP